MKGFLLDTSFLVALQWDDPVAVRKVQSLEPDTILFTSAITLGELVYGLHRVPPPKREELEARLHHALELVVDILPVTPEVARKYGEIKANLAAKGRPIPTNDVWIASIALVHNLTVISADPHFDEVEGLSRENWLAER